MTTEERHLINELTHDLAYNRLRFSELWNGLPANAAIDAKAEELRVHLSTAMEEWVLGEEVKVAVAAEGNK